MKSPTILTLLGVSLIVGGCSALKKQSGETAGSGDARPLFPVTTENSQGLKAIALDGRWYVKTVAGKTLAGIDDYEWPFVEFVPAEARFYGNNGCNVINGSYRIGTAQTLTLSDIATTMRLCPDDSIGFLIDDALNNTASYSTSQTADGTKILSLHNARNFTVMTLRKSEIDFIAGPWQVTEIDGKPCEAPDARLIFDVDAGKVYGNAGCNRLNGELSRDPRIAASVQFANLATTRMMCPFIDSETRLLLALENVATARTGGHNTLELLSPAGAVLVKLTRLTKADLQQSEN